MKSITLTLAALLLSVNFANAAETATEAQPTVQPVASEEIIAIEEVDGSTKKEDKAAE